MDIHKEWKPAGVYTLGYTVKNRGSIIAAAGHDVGLTVDGAPVDLGRVGTVSDIDVGARSVSHGSGRVRRRSGRVGCQPQLHRVCPKS